jgi:uncharacterized protein YacL
MKMIALIIMVAIVLEAIVEYVKTVMKMVEDREYKTAITQGVTIALGIAFAFIFNLQLFNGALSEFYEGLKINPTIDMILTGILFSRGANYFSDLVTRLTRKDDLFSDDVTPQTDEDDEAEDSTMIDESEATPSNEKASE